MIDEYLELAHIAITKRQSIFSALWFIPKLLTNYLLIISVI